jgi:AraC-like DNA-binding protein
MGTLQLAAVGLAGSAVGWALGAPMLWPASGRPSSVRLMGAWLTAASAIAALISSRLLGFTSSTVAVDHLVNFLGFAAYPLLYLWVRDQVGLPSRIAHNAWLWTPAAVYGCLTLARGAVGAPTRLPFVLILPVILGFTALCLLAVARDAPSRQPSPRSIVSARVVVGFLVLLNVSQVARMLFGHLTTMHAAVPITMAAGFVGMVATVVWRALEVRSEQATDVAAARYERSSLEPAAAATLLSAIDTAMSTRRLYADPELTLRQLALAVNATQHQVSEALNRYGGESFHDLLNRYRVDDVKNQLLASSSERFTIEGIGTSAGFKSRSALYAAFRRLEGMTPAEFRTRRRAATQAD